jgi:hypothetical protein
MQENETKHFSFYFAQFYFLKTNFYALDAIRDHVTLILNLIKE